MLHVTSSFIHKPPSLRRVDRIHFHLVTNWKPLHTRAGPNTPCITSVAEQLKLPLVPTTSYDLDELVSFSLGQSPHSPDICKELQLSFEKAAALSLYMQGGGGSAAGGGGNLQASGEGGGSAMGAVSTVPSVPTAGVTKTQTVNIAPVAAHVTDMGAIHDTGIEADSALLLSSVGGEDIYDESGAATIPGPSTEQGSVAVKADPVAVSVDMAMSHVNQNLGWSQTLAAMKT